MTIRNQDYTKVFTGKMVNIVITDDKSGSPVVVLEIQDMEEGNFLLTDTPKLNEKDMRDGKIMRSITGRDTLFQGTIVEALPEEVTSITDFSTGEGSIVLTSVENSTNDPIIITLTIKAGDLLMAAMNENEIQITAYCSRAGDVIPYAITQPEVT